MQRALEGDEVAISALMGEYSTDLKNFLKGAGGDLADVTEVVDSLWADGLMGPSEKAPTFRRYSGQSSLRTWLKTVALNKLIDLKRHKTRVEAKLVPLIKTSENGDETRDVECADDVGATVESAEAPLLRLIREAVEEGFRSCEAEQYVLLQLYFRDGLYQDELARMWSCNASTISRHIETARIDVQRTTLNHIRSVDSWLDLHWADFVEVCKVVGPALVEPR